MPAADDMLAGWTEAQLWDAWHSSLDKLAHALNDEERYWRVQQRQLYLDELELRNPRAFRRWLQQGNILDMHPSRFMGPEF